MRVFRVHETRRTLGALQVPGHNRAHYSGSYEREARAVREAAYRNPDTRCRRCGRTLQQHAPHRNGTPARWDAGHVNDGQPGGPLAPEASTCNRSAGAQLGNRTRRLSTSRRW